MDNDISQSRYIHRSAYFAFKRHSKSSLDLSSPLVALNQLGQLRKDHIHVKTAGKVLEAHLQRFLVANNSELVLDFDLAQRECKHRKLGAVAEDVVSEVGG